MKTLLLFSTVILFGVNTKSQTLNWAWAKRTTSSTGTNQGQSIHANKSLGGIYATGPYSSGITFGTYTLTGTGAYVVKYDSLGAVNFAFKAASATLINAVKLTTDHIGNIYLAGSYYGNLVVGTNSVTASGLDAFIAKYDAAGNVLWLKTITGSQSEYVYDITTDGINNVILTGSYTGSLVSVASATLSNTNFSALNNAFTAKLDLNGNVTWVKQPLGISDAKAVAIDTNGEIYIAGTFGDSLFFGTTKLMKLGSGNDIFIAKYDVNGNILWASRQGSKGADELYGMDIDASNNILITGEFADVANGFTVGSTTVLGSYDIYLAKYTSNGIGLWVKSAGGANYDYGKDVAVDAAGNAYVFGYFESPSVVAGTFTVTNTAGGGSGGFNDLIIIKYDTNGNELLAGNVSGSRSDYGLGICVDANNQIYVTGYSQSTSLVFGTNTLTLPGFDNFYIAKLKSIIITGTSELHKIDDIKLYPNPANSLVKIGCEELFYSVEVYDVKGSLIYKEEIKSKTHILNIQELTNGVYYIRLKLNNGEYVTKKLVKQ